MRCFNWERGLVFVEVSNASVGHVVNIGRVDVIMDVSWFVHIYIF
jgi:hypothetical protein